MSFEERFEFIENGLVTVIKIQSRQAESLDQITQTFGRHVDSTDARMKRIEESVGGLAQTVGHLTQTVNGLGEKMDRYMDLADARMNRLEENLDVLIRANTADHSNGKTKH